MKPDYIKYIVLQFLLRFKMLKNFSVVKKTLALDHSDESCWVNYPAVYRSIISFFFSFKKKDKEREGYLRRVLNLP